MATNVIQNKIALVRQHAVRVLVHAETVSAYIEAYQREKGFFGDGADLWNNIVADPDRWA